MKILFIADGCHPATQGGIQTFGRALKKMFKEELFFLSYKTKKNKLFNVNNSIEIGSSSFVFLVFNKLLKNLFRNILLKDKIKKVNPDVCILRSPQNLKNLKNIQCKKILVQHLQLDNYFKSKSYYNLEDELLETSKKELDYFIVTSPKDKEKLINDFNFPEEKVKVIRHSCEIESLKKTKKKNKNLIMIARLDNNQKRFDLAIKAMKNLHEFTLKIYGSGPDKKALEKIILKNNIKNVKLCGETDEIEQKLDEAGIFIMTSDFEGYPVTAIEAMRRGLPIIMRNTFEGASDIVINNGILLEIEWNEKKFCEYVRQIYNNYEYYSKNSIHMAKRYDLDIIKTEWEKVIN